MPGEPPAGSSDGGRVQHESHRANLIHFENHNSSFCSLHLSQETSTHEFIKCAHLS